MTIEMRRTTTTTRNVKIINRNTKNHTIETRKIIIKQLCHLNTMISIISMIQMDICLIKKSFWIKVKLETAEILREGAGMIIMISTGKDEYHSPDYIICIEKVKKMYISYWRLFNSSHWFLIFWTKSLIIIYK